MQPGDTELEDPATEEGEFEGDDMQVAPDGYDHPDADHDQHDPDAAGGGNELRGIDPDELDEHTRARVLERAGGKLDDSLYDAQRDILQERELASRAIVYRDWPEEWQGTTIKGRVRMWRSPFTLVDIEEWLASYRGGGKYRIRLLDGRGRYLDQKILEVEGDPILPGTKEESEASAPAQQLANDDRAAALERQLQEERFERRMTEERARQQIANERMTRALSDVVEAVKEKPEPEPKTNLVDMAAALGPIAMQFVQMQQANAAAMRELQANQAAAAATAAQAQMTLILTLQEKSEARNIEMLKAMTGKKETLGDAIKAMADLRKVTGADKDPSQMFNTLMKESVPVLLSTMSRIELHKAGVREDNQEEQSLTTMLVDRVSGLAEAFMTTRTAEPTPGYGQAPVAPTPQQPPPGVEMAPTPQAMPTGGNPVVSPEQQAAHEASMRAGVPAPAAPQAPPQAQEEAAINPQLFVRAIVYMNEGQAGSALADDIIGEEEKNATDNPGASHLYLAPRVVQFLVNTSPEGVLAVINPHLRNDPRFQALLDPIGQEFFRDFCLYFSAPEEGGDGDGDPDAHLEAESDDTPPPAADITGGAVAPEEPTV